MAHVSNRRFAELVKKVVVEGLSDVGIQSTVDYEQISGTRLFRFCILAPKFKSMGLTERHDVVWKVIDSAIPKDDQIRISRMVIMTPKEWASEMEREEREREEREHEERHGKAPDILSLQDTPFRKRKAQKRELSSAS